MTTSNPVTPIRPMFESSPPENGVSEEPGIAPSIAAADGSQEISGTGMPPGAGAAPSEPASVTSDNAEAAESSPNASPPPPDPLVSFDDFDTATDRQIGAKLAHDLRKIVAWAEQRGFCPIAILDPSTSLGSFELDRIFAALEQRNPDGDRDVLLLLLSTGGSIEPAYQISKICKSHSKNRFVVCIPRYAKSAATLIALGADEIHMGPLGHLGPIDPQIDGLPALAVAQALDTIAATAERRPQSAAMLAKYLEQKLSVEQIGYFDRIVESAAQYAERLLQRKSSLLPKAARDIAHELVYEYKDHGFVIDVEEAQAHLGAGWVLADTELSEWGDAIYTIFSIYEQMLTMRKRRIYFAGSLNAQDIAQSVAVWTRR